MIAFKESDRVDVIKCITDIGIDLGRSRASLKVSSFLVSVCGPDELFFGAMLFGPDALVKFLVHKGANIHDHNPLYLPTLNNRVPIIKFLISVGATISHEIFCSAIFNDHYNVVKLYIESGVDIRACGDEALQTAALSGNKHTVKLLVERGADIHVDNDRPLCLAASEGHESVVRYLVKKGSMTNEALCIAARDGKERIVRFLTKKGADIHVDNDSPLGLAALRGHESIIRFLVKKGARHAQALEWAKRKHHDEIIDIFEPSGN